MVAIQQTAASKAGLVDQARPCRECGEVSATGPRGDMIQCDACDDAYHFKCLRPHLHEPPDGLWACPRWPGCQARAPTAAGSKRPLEEPTYNFLRAPRLDKAGRRKAAGLETMGFPTRADLDRIVEFRWAPRTKQAYERTHKVYQDFCTEGGLEARELESLCLFALRRLQQGACASTIRRDLTAVRQMQPLWRGDEARLTLTLRAVGRLADVPDEKRLPLTPEHLRQLRRVISSWETRAAHAKERRLRDWTFYLLGFVGFFRGSELVALEWSHLRFIWRRGEREWTTATPLPPTECPQAEPREVHLHVVASKTDQVGQGQLVRVAAKARTAELRDFECPFRLLRNLWKARPREAKHVFADPANGKGITTNTMLGRLRRYLAQVFQGQPGAEKLYGLHSARRGGATHAFRSGVSMPAIKKHGRWKSDVVFLYTVVSDQEALDLSVKLLGDLDL